jgi:hypothetical protein
MTDQPTSAREAAEQLNASDVLAFIGEVNSTWEHSGATIPQIAEHFDADYMDVYRIVDQLRTARKVHHGGGYRTGIVVS